MIKKPLYAKSQKAWRTLTAQSALLIAALGVSAGVRADAFVAASSGLSAEQMGQLTNRLDTLEKRLAELGREDASKTLFTQPGAGSAGAQNTTAQNITPEAFNPLTDPLVPNERRIVLDALLRQELQEIGTVNGDHLLRINGVVMVLDAQRYASIRALTYQSLREKVIKAENPQALLASLPATTHHTLFGAGPQNPGAGTAPGGMDAQTSDTQDDSSDLTEQARKRLEELRKKNHQTTQRNTTTNNRGSYRANNESSASRSSDYRASSSAR